jgi:cardiolipin synthase
MNTDKTKPHPRVHSWESEKLYHCGDSFYQSIFEEFQKAQSTIHLEVHFFDDQKLGRIFFKNIIKALERGVKVFIIVDGFSPKSQKLKYWMALYKRKGGQLSFFHPLPWRIPCVEGIFKLNVRSHKKVILIDKKVSYLGSYNIDTRQMSTHFGGEDWRDIGVRVEGSQVKYILNGFYDTWKYCRGFKFNQVKPHIKNNIIRLNHKKSWRKSYLQDLIERLNSAKEKVWITNPYFVPDLKMLNALENARARGVDVKILIPQKSDLKLFPLINSIFYRDLVRKGVGVYEYKPSILHAKIMIIDNWMMLGSSNLNSRTQKHDWEIDITLTKQDTKLELLKRFKRDLNHSSLLSYGDIIEKYRGQQYSIPFLRAIKYFL